MDVSRHPTQFYFVAGRLVLIARDGGCDLVVRELDVHLHMIAPQETDDLHPADRMKEEMS
jgi:hypothetical protein